jgi:hypothetical protein
VTFLNERLEQFEQRCELRAFQSEFARTFLWRFLPGGSWLTADLPQAE